MGPYEEKFTEILKRFEGNKEVHFSNAEMREFFMCMTYCSMYLIEIICKYNELLDAHRELNDAATETIDTQVKTINALQTKYDKLGMALHTQNFILGVLMEKNNIRVESDSTNLTS